MKKWLSLVWMVGIILGLFAAGGSEATSYTIDGNVNDWGIDLSSATSAGYLDTNLPLGGWDVDYVTEDNADKYHKWTKVGPLYSYYNYFDAEAMYFDNDQSYAYIAIIQGLPKDGYDPPRNGGDYTFKPGDIFIDVDYDGIYEYGLNISDSHLYNNHTCNEEYYTKVYYNDGSEANPWKINEDKLWLDKGEVTFVYSGEQYTHYVLEAAIPLSYLGLSANPDDPIQPLTIHWTQECGNDYLNLDADINPVPEPATMLLLGSGLIGLGWFGRRKVRNVP